MVRRHIIDSCYSYAVVNVINLIFIRGIEMTRVELVLFILFIMMTSYMSLAIYTTFDNMVEDRKAKTEVIMEQLR